jgi:TonB family protein
MRISKTTMVVILFLLGCGLAALRISLASASDTPVVGADLPLYPALARTANIQGKVELQVTTGADGRVVSALAKGGHPLLERAALDNVKTWRFAGQSERTVTYEFRVEARAVNSFDDYYRYGSILFHPPNSVEIIVPPTIVEPQKSRSPGSGDLANPIR